MPIIEVTLTEGRSEGELRELIHQLTAGAVTALNAPIESVRVLIREIPRTHFAAGDVTLQEREEKK